VATRSQSAPSRPGRPRGFDTATVVDGALELFWKKGFANTTTRELEAELSLNQSSIYNAFGSKEQLLQAVLDRYEALTQDELLTPLEESSDGLAAIERFFDDLSDWITRSGRCGCMLINMMAEDGGATNAITARTSRYRRRVRAALRAALASAVARKELVDTDLEARASLLFTVVLGLNIAARSGADRSELQQMLDSVRVQLAGWRESR
jgi:AcrR family transcriptional regulator